ncbi:MAG: response regulator transcription factor [Betaproteobacteria bacterium]|nr:MAG: response regulator transcription factor [Betaproteobacteria bacterium]
MLEDEQDQADLVSAWLNAAGHSCHVYLLGKDLVREAQRETFDLFLLDWEVPGMSGAEVLVWIRANIAAPVPVLFVTARQREEDIVHALSSGADDYMVKPLGKLELLARIDALARRSRANPNQAEDVLEYGRLSVDCRNRQAKLDGEEVALTQKDFELAVFLLRNMGRLLSRGHILEAVWAQSAEINTRTVDTHVSRIRGKLKLTPENGWRLSAIYQHGYRLERVAAAAAQ